MKFLTGFKISVLDNEPRAINLQHKKYNLQKRRNLLKRHIWREQTLTLDDWDENKKWGKEELEHFATLMIKEANKDKLNPYMDHPFPVLTRETLRDRLKHEIYTNYGVPDPAMVSGMYWRTHPAGLKWRNKEDAKALGFYK